MLKEAANSFVGRRFRAAAELPLGVVRDKWPVGGRVVLASSDERSAT
jgi:hypothetical protein